MAEISQTTTAWFSQLLILAAATFSMTVSANAATDSSAMESLNAIQEVQKVLKKKQNRLKAKFHQDTSLRRNFKLVNPDQPISKATPKSTKNKKTSEYLTFTSVSQNPVFDLPITYNGQVMKWLKHFQGRGKKWFKRWLARSNRYLPFMRRLLKKRGLPTDLAYVAMIESGFSAHAVSSASAVGYWQFIKPTANKYGLKTKWWLDERRDFEKSTRAAAAYLEDLYRIFDSWYLSAAGYNMGETRLNRLILKHKTKNYWKLATKPDFPRETREYVPKLIAAMLISKAPKLYGFQNIDFKPPYSYELFYVPGGTDLHNLANHLGVRSKALKSLNPALLKGFVPKAIARYPIRIPKGTLKKVSMYIRKQL